jgi:putative ABC transport system permease protein
VALLAPRLVAPLARVVGWPAARLGGEAGRLARANAVRNPARTAITAAALMIGLALVTFVAVVGSGMRDSATSAVRDQVTADGVVTSRNGWNTLTRGAGEAVAGAPGVEAATSVRYERAQVGGSNADVHGVDPGAIGRFYRFDWTAGDGDPLASLGAERAVVRKDFADDHDVAVGDVLPIVTPTGERFEARVAGVFEANRFDALLGEVLIPHDSFDAEFSRPADLFTFVDLADGASLGAARAAADGFPDALVQTKDAWVDARVSDFATILNLLYVLLALSVVVSLFGMVNALVLAVLERRRELGMLRAIGLSRRQARRMIRHESVITALIGAALGMPLGIALAAAVTQALSEYDLGFSLPVGTLAAFAVVAVVAGVLAAVVPARRAARLDVLSALQYE